MRYQHRFCRLQMRVRRHGCAARIFRLFDKRLDQLDQLALKLIDRVSHEQAQVSCDLLIATASGVQLEANIAGELHQPAFEKVMDVLGLTVLQEMGITLENMLDVIESFEQRLQFRRREHTDAGERASMRAAGSDLLRQKALVERPRPLPLLEFRIERPAKAA